jgi:hypothetical protein
MSSGQENRKERANLLLNQEELFEKHCFNCGIMEAIEAAGHSKKAQQEYCNIICPVGKQLRNIGQALDRIALRGKDLELNKKNMRPLIEQGLKNEELAEIFKTSPSTIARKKREFGLVLKNYNCSLTVDLYKQELGAGLSRVEICAKYDIGKSTLVRKLIEWGITSNDR